MLTLLAALGAQPTAEEIEAALDLLFSTGSLDIAAGGFVFLPMNTSATRTVVPQMARAAGASSGGGGGGMLFAAAGAGGAVLVLIVIIAVILTRRKRRAMNKTQSVSGCMLVGCPGVFFCCFYLFMCSAALLHCSVVCFLSDVDVWVRMSFCALLTSPQASSVLTRRDSRLGGKAGVSGMAFVNPMYSEMVLSEEAPAGFNGTVSHNPLFEGDEGLYHDSQAVASEPQLDGNDGGYLDMAPAEAVAEAEPEGDFETIKMQSATAVLPATGCVGCVLPCDLLVRSAECLCFDFLSV